MPLVVEAGFVHCAGCGALVTNVHVISSDYYHL